MKDHERIILDKIKAYAIQTIEFKNDIDFSDFSKDPKTIAAVVFNLSQIGELTSHLNDEFTKSHSQIPWRNIKGMRNKIVHDYEGIQLNIVWDVLVTFLPKLIIDIDEILI